MSEQTEERACGAINPETRLVCVMPPHKPEVEHIGNGEVWYSPAPKNVPCDFVTSEDGIRCIVDHSPHQGPHRGLIADVLQAFGALSPCPFCGGPATVNHFDQDFPQAESVGCTSCDVFMPTTRAWNGRAASPQGTTDAQFAAAIRAITEEHKNCAVLQLRETEDCSILDDIMNAHHEIYGAVLCPVKESP